MKKTKLQRVLATALAVTMILGTTMTVGATDTSNTAGAGGAGSTSSATTSSASTAAAAAVAATVPATSSVTVGGVTFVTTVKGAYLAKTVDGIAVTTPAADIAASYGLTSAQTLFVLVMDTDKKASHKAMDSLNAAAAALNATMGPVLNIDLGYRESNLFHQLSAGSTEITMTVAVPADFRDAQANYAVIVVRYGGAITVLPDLDEYAETVTFNTTGGLGCYAIVKY